MTIAVEEAKSAVKVTTRILGLDLLRLFSFFAIIIYHFNWMVWNTYDGNLQTSIWIWASIYARALSFSGFTIVFLSSLLIAMNTSLARRFWKFYIVLLFAWAVFNYLGRQENPFFWTWEIYPLLLVGLWSSRAVERWLPEKSVLILFLTGVLTLSCPFWELEEKLNLPLWIGHMLIGDCRIDVAEWPIFPWIALIWMGYSVGLLIRTKNLLKGGLSPRLAFTLKESWVWLVLLSLSTFFGLGQYYQTPLGQWFTCFILRQSPLIFWAHFIWVLFLVRLSLDYRVQKSMSESVALTWISNLAMSRRFGLAYFVQYLVAAVWALIIQFKFSTSHEVVDFALLTFLPLTEILTRLVEFSLKQTSKFLGNLRQNKT